MHVQVAASGEPTTIEKLCSDMCGSLESRRDGPTRSRAFTDNQEECRDWKANRYPADSDLCRGLATGPGADGARAAAPTPVRGCARHLRRVGPARRCERASVRGHLRALLASDAYPTHQVVCAPRSWRAGTAWRGGAHSFAQMGEAFGMRRSGIIACHVSFLASDRDGSLAIEVG